MVAGFEYPIGYRTYDSKLFGLIKLNKRVCLYDIIDTHMMFLWDDPDRIVGEIVCKEVPELSEYHHMITNTMMSYRILNW